jgi:ABC-type glycerol-3-phosphate transport system substrate-binding protein
MDEIIERIKTNRIAQIFIGIIILFIIGSIWYLNKILSKQKKEVLPCYNQTITILSPFTSTDLTELNAHASKYCLKLTFEQRDLDYIKNNLLKDIAQGNIPDIVFVDSDFLLENLNIFQEYKGKILNIDEYPESIIEPLNNKLIAYPLYFDVLVTFANREYLNNAGLLSAPKTFEELKNVLPSLRILDPSYNIQLAPIALGTANNIDRLFEIFVTIHKNLNEDKYKDINSFYNTLDFYTQFANKSSPYFAWQEYLPNSFVAFAQGQVALIFGFYSDKDRILDINRRIKLEIYPFLRFAGKTKSYNYIKTYFFAVPKQGKHKYAWMVLEFFDKYYEKFISKKDLLPIKKALIEKVDKNKKEIVKDLLIGDYFYEFNREYFENAIKVDIQNWLSDKENVKRLINIEQIRRFFKK